jgi:SAM-dependent methyltransferase
MNDSGNDIQEAQAHRRVVERLWTEPVYDGGMPDLEAADTSSVLVAESRCGYIPSRLAEAIPSESRIIALDPSRAMLDQARERLAQSDRRIFFVPQRVNHLSYADDVFSLSVCLNGGVSQRNVAEALGELSRVTNEGGRVVFAAPLQTAFPQFYDMLDESLRAHQLNDVLGRMYELRSAFLTPARLAGLAEQVGLKDVKVSELEWEVEFESGDDLLFSPLIRETFFSQWIGIVRSSDREPILRYISDAIDTYWHGSDFVCQVRAGCLIAQR